MSRFNLSDHHVYGTLDLVHFFQSLLTLSIGLLLIISPSRRFGSPYQFIFELSTYGDDIFGVIFLVVSFVMFYALRARRKLLFGHLLLFSGLFIWILAVFLLLGAIFGPTGVLSSPFCFYAGGHMILQAVLLTKDESPTSFSKWLFGSGIRRSKP